MAGHSVMSGAFPTFSMATPDGTSTVQLPRGVQCHTYPVSPTEELSEPRPSKKRRASRLFGPDSLSTSDDEYDQPARPTKHRKSSLFSFLSSKPARKHSLEKMPVSNTDIEQGRQDEMPPEQHPLPHDTSDAPIEPERRRSSLARIKEFFMRKRKDSAVEDGAASRTMHGDSHHITGVQYFNQGLEPLAMGECRSERCYAKRLTNWRAVSRMKMLDPLRANLPSHSIRRP
jgi:hypothetical protein